MVTRKELRDIEGVRLPFVCPAIPAGSFIVVEFDGTKLYKYKPFNVVSVFNNSTNLIKVYINQNGDEMYPVAGKTEREIDKIWCHNLRIENAGSTDIASGDIVLMLERKGITTDELAKQQARRWLW
jgi:hypothetical protein